MNNIKSQILIKQIEFFKTRKQFNDLRKEMIGTLEHLYPENTAGYVSEAFGGGIKSYDAVIMNHILNLLKPQSILEVGCYLGQSSRWIMESTQTWNASMTCVDPNIHHRAFEQPRKVFEEFALKPNANRLNYIEAFFAADKLENDLTRLYPEKANFWAPPEGTLYDFMFIDAGHSYEEIKHDYELAINYLKPGGAMMFHDTYSWEGVGQLMNEIGAMTFVPWWYKAARSFFVKRNYYIDGIGLYINK